MKENDYIEKTLRTINQVEPSPYLFTRIESKIQSLTNNTISMKKAMIGMALTCMLVVLNIIITSSNSQNNTKNLLDELNISTSNHLYYE